MSFYECSRCGGVPGMTPCCRDTPLVHPDDQSVDAFSQSMKDKLRHAREKHNRGGWQDPSDLITESLIRQLVDHLRKGNAGNFVDIANYCMMLHQRGTDPALLARALSEQ